MTPIRALFAAAAFAAIATPAVAQDVSDNAAPAATKHWIVRLRAIRVTPTERTGPIYPTFPTAHTAVSNSYTAEVDATYMATPHIGVEVIAATTKHDISGRGSLGGLGDLAHTWVLPPTVTLQYHFAPHGHVRPYVGAGVNYTIFYSEKATGTLNRAIGHTSVGLSDSVGYALQAGVDVDVSRKVFVNFDLKYLDIDTTAHLHTGALTNRERVHLDPLVPGIGIGMRF